MNPENFTSEDEAALRDALKRYGRLPKPKDRDRTE